MSTIVNQMTKTFDMPKLGYDMMGYEFKHLKDLSYHHLILPKKQCKQMGLSSGRFYWNGAVLVRDTSHDYLHTIELYDLDAFYYITSELFDEVIKKRIDPENLRRIDEILCEFENKFREETNGSHQYIIKEQYLTRRRRRNL